MNFLWFSIVLCGSLVLAVPESQVYTPPRPPSSRPQCPASDAHGYYCADNCVSDSQCGDNKFCCQLHCGGTCMTELQQTQSPKCPPHQSLQCRIFNHQCNNDEDCSKDGRRGHCCLEPGCGRHCVPEELTTEPVPSSRSQCPASDAYGYYCADNCVSDSQCGDNKFCCQLHCGGTCMTELQQTQSPKCPPHQSRACIVFIHQCNNDEDCSKDGRRGHCCLEPGCGRHCVPEELTTKPAPSSRPQCPASDAPGYHSCPDPCVSDSQCGDNKFCCQLHCGGTCMTELQQTQSPKCPPPDLEIRCIAFIHQCNNDEDCSKDGRRGYCCLEPACGRHCVAEELTTQLPPSSRPQCPASDAYGYYCADTCVSDSQCGDNKFCCQLHCGGTCMTGLQQTQSPKCPPHQSLQCIVFIHKCNNDEDCSKDGRRGHCCLEPGCGRHCVAEELTTKPPA